MKTSFSTATQTGLRYPLSPTATDSIPISPIPAVNVAAVPFEKCARMSKVAMRKVKVRRNDL